MLDLGADLMEIVADSMDHLVLLLTLLFCVSMFLEAEKFQ